ncbi:MAG: tetraacyldisaccharide 4'-kinase [Planctomycetales bacterium]|nr:tetraacyldisaccharide 4'-kinase [Planctomycetales bacterium]
MRRTRASHDRRPATVDEFGRSSYHRRSLLKLLSTNGENSIVFTAADFKAIVSGQRSGIGAALARCALRAAETPYAAAMLWRNCRYDRGAAEVHRVEVPVISVGNLTLGGTGKTPMVAWLARWFRNQGVRVCLISRGYKTTDGARNDEAMELEQRLPDVPHLQNPDRVAAARIAIDELDTQLILLDDGFQHRRLHRDLDIVLLDALEPFGHEHVFPRGMLREPIRGLRRADVICLTRADAVSDSARQALADRIIRLASGVTYCEAVSNPSGLLNSTGRQRPVQSLQGQSVLAFCGIGNPAGFRHTLESAGLDVLQLREFADHHHYDRNDLRRIADWAASYPSATAIICTHKDLVKISLNALGKLPLYALEIQQDFIRGRSELESHLYSFTGAIE